MYATLQPITLKHKTIMAIFIAFLVLGAILGHYRDISRAVSASGKGDNCSSNWSTHFCLFLPQRPASQKLKLHYNDLFLTRS